MLAGGAAGQAGTKVQEVNGGQLGERAGAMGYNLCVHTLKVMHASGESWCGWDRQAGGSVFLAVLSNKSD
jgi:hypothetical protein